MFTSSPRSQAINDVDDVIATSSNDAAAGRSKLYSDSERSAERALREPRRPAVCDVRTFVCERITCFNRSLTGRQCITSIPTASKLWESNDTRASR